MTARDCTGKLSSGSASFGCVRSYPTALLALACLFGAGCTDGAGTSGGTGGSGSTLPGTVLVDDGAATRRYGVIFAIDPVTGEAREHVTAFPDLDDNTRYANGSSFLVGGSGDDGSLLLTVQDCVPPLGSDSCVERVDADGTIERLFTLPLWVQQAAVGSPDGTLVAAIVSPGRVDGPYELRLYTPRGEVIASQTLSQRLESFAHHDWAPGNRLVYGLSDSEEGGFIAVASPGTLVPEEGFRVSDGTQRVGAISVSPDGASIAYELIPEDGVSDTTSWVLDRADGTSTRVADAGELSVFSPEWSPDGRYLFVLTAVGTSFSGTVPQQIGAPLPFEVVVEWAGETVSVAPYDGVGRRLEVDESTLADRDVDDDRWLFGQAFWVR